MYIDSQIRSLLQEADLTGKDKWINIKASKEKVIEYKNSMKEFTIDELVGMVMISDSEIMMQDLMVKDLRFQVYFDPSKRDEINRKMEMMFKGHVMINVRKNQNGKFVIEKVSN